MCAVLNDEMLRFARQFPCAESLLSHLTTWNPSEVEKIALGGVSEAERHVLNLLLHIWNPRQHWQCGPFDAIAAIQTWDWEHQHIFAAWVKNPWWP